MVVSWFHFAKKGTFQFQENSLLRNSLIKCTYEICTFNKGFAGQAILGICLVAQNSFEAPAITVLIRRKGRKNEIVNRASTRQTRHGLEVFGLFDIF